MSDSPYGFGMRGQTTSERVGGWDEIVIAIRNTAILGLLEFVGIVLLGLASVMGGPWSLVILAPSMMRNVIHWYTPEVKIERGVLASWGAIVAVLLLATLALDTRNLVLGWWPWRWQATRETWFGLLFPLAFPKLIGGLLVVRVILVAGTMRAWKQTWYLKQRLMTETIAPTRSGVTYKPADVENMDIPGVHNPYTRSPEPLAVPVEALRTTAIHNLPATQEVERVGNGVLIGGGNGGHRMEQWPTEWFAGSTSNEKLAAQYQFAAFVLEDPGRNYSRNRCSGFFESTIRARLFFDWMRERHYATQVNRTTQALTASGAWLLQSIADDWETEPIAAELLG